MKKFLGLTKRNLLLFFKDKQSVVFSLLTSIIVFALYLFFLRDTFVDGINSALNKVDGISSLISGKDVEMYANMILLVGILGSAMITVPFSCLTTVIKDKENKVDYDILSTPAKRWQIILSYFSASTISSILMNGIILTVGLLVLSFQGNIHMNAFAIAKAYGVVALGSTSSTALFMLIILCFKSSSASGAFFGMLSAASGFVIGAYIPISQFSSGVQTVCNLFPASQVTILLRNVLLEGTLDSFNTSIGGLDNGKFVEVMQELFTFHAKIAKHSLTVNQMFFYVLGITVLCIGVMIFFYSKNYRKK